VAARGICQKEIESHSALSAGAGTNSGAFLCIARLVAAYKKSRSTPGHQPALYFFASAIWAGHTTTLLLRACPKTVGASSNSDIKKIQLFISIMFFCC
jgi:hypothetical protein